MVDSLNKTHEPNLEEWVVVRTAGGSYLGRVVSPVLSKVMSQRDEAFDKFKTAVLASCEVGAMLALSPCFDFMAPLKPTPGPNGQPVLSREPVIVPFDFLNSETPVFVKASSIMFLGSLQGTDKKLYKDFVLQATELLLRTRMRESGLELAGPGQIPAHGGPKRG